MNFIGNIKRIQSQLISYSKLKEIQKKNCMQIWNRNLVVFMSFPTFSEVINLFDLELVEIIAYMCFNEKSFIFNEIFHICVEKRLRCFWIRIGKQSREIGRCRLNWSEKNEKKNTTKDERKMKIKKMCPKPTNG